MISSSLEHVDKVPPKRHNKLIIIIHGVIAQKSKNSKISFKQNNMKIWICVGRTYSNSIRMYLKTYFIWLNAICTLKVFEFRPLTLVVHGSI